MLSRFSQRLFFAVRGIAILIRTQAHARFHLLATVIVVLLGLAGSISSSDWMWLAIAISLVWIAEALNTAVEFLADAIHPEEHPLIGHAKDVAAGGVLIAALCAVVIGFLVFLPWCKDILLSIQK